MSLLLMIAQCGAKQYNQWLLLNTRYPRKAAGQLEAKTIKGWPYIPGMRYDAEPAVQPCVLVGMQSLAKLVIILVFILFYFFIFFIVIVICIRIRW